MEGDKAEATLEVIKKTVDYMKNVVFGGKIDLDESIVGECTNKEECECMSYSIICYCCLHLIEIMLCCELLLIQIYCCCLLFYIYRL